MFPRMLPPLFQMEDYNTCLASTNSFCKIYANLRSIDNDSQIWNYIRDSYENEHLFDRSILRRGLCIPHQDAKDMESVKAFSEVLVNEEIRSINLTAEVNVIGCHNDDFSMTTYDIIFLIIFMAYSGLILFATLYSLMGLKVLRGSQFISIFSIQNNWRKRTNPKKNIDHEKLKSIQGVRVLSLMMILLIHTKMGYGMVYLENPSFLEKVFENPIMNYINIIDIFTVNSFFMISSWLLTIQILDISKNNVEFCLRQVGIIILNRYFRLALLQGVLIALCNTSMTKYATGPLNIEIILPHDKACRTNWLHSLLFINNFQFILDMCNPVTWYLAADFQMYVLNTFTFYIIIKYKLNAFKTFGVLLAMASVLYGTIIFLYDTDMIYPIALRNMEFIIFSKSMSFFITYQSTISIFGCSSVGIFLGLIYSKTKNNIVKNDFITTFFWFILFLGLPLLVITISSHEFKGFSGAVLGPLLKPLLVLGIGIGILGMSHNIGGVVKKIFESRFFQISANFNYGIYICQLPFCFFRSKYEMFPIEIGYMSLIQDYLKVMVYCSIVGIIMTLTVEEPGITLQKMFLPNIKRKKDRDETIKEE